MHRSERADDSHLTDTDDVSEVAEHGDRRSVRQALRAIEQRVEEVEWAILAARRRGADDSGEQREVEVLRRRADELRERLTAAPRSWLARLLGQS